MGQRVYGFDEQFAIGKRGEAALDAFLSGRLGARVLDVRQLERAGVDRVYTMGGANHMLVEYKTDMIAAETGNAFIELVSVNKDGRQGWAYTCKSDALIYFCADKTGGGRAFWLTPARIHAELPSWLVRYPRRTVHNANYEGQGLLVPLAEIERIAVLVYNVPSGQMAAAKA
jgi:hypothetical protein